MAWFDRLKQGLAKTRTQFTDSVTQVLRGRALGPDQLEELEEVLITADVGTRTALGIVKDLRIRLRGSNENPEDVLQALMRERLIGSERALRIRGQEPTVLFIAGVNGAGKTTTIAKMASHLRNEQPNLPITFAAADTFRAAAVEQLGVWAERVRADVIRHAAGSDPSAVVFDAVEHVRKTGGVLFIDTAGRLQTKHNLMEELKKIERTVVKKLGRGSDERLLVLDATTGQNGLLQAERFHAAIDLTGLVLTKLDSSAKGGGIFAICESLELPILYVGVGETADDLHAFSADEFVDALFAQN